MVEGEVQIKRVQHFIAGRARGNDMHSHNSKARNERIFTPLHFIMLSEIKCLKRL